MVFHTIAHIIYNTLWHQIVAPLLIADFWKFHHPWAFNTPKYKFFLQENHNFAWASIFLTFPETEPEIFLNFS